MLSSGADPYADLLKFAELNEETEKLLSISLGMRQGIPERYIKQAIEHRLWLTTMATANFPVSILQRSVKITNAILLRAYLDRRKYDPLGWNISYGFCESDLRVCVQQLYEFIDMFEEILTELLTILIEEQVK